MQVHVTDRQRFKPFLTGVAEIMVAREQAPGEFEWKAPPYEFELERLPIDILFGTDVIRRQIERGEALPTIEAAWRKGLPLYNRRRSPFLIYD